MTKEIWQEKLKQIKEEISEKEKAIQELRTEYIESNKPFDVGVEVNLVLASGRTAKGVIHTLGILQDKDVYVTAYKDANDGGKIKYITKPYQSISKV